MVIKYGRLSFTLSFCHFSVPFLKAHSVAVVPNVPPTLSKYIFSFLEVPGPSTDPDFCARKH